MQPGGEIPRPFPWKFVLLLAAMSGVIALAHWPALSSTAYCFDDNEYLYENRLVQSPSWDSVSRFFSEVLHPSTVRGYYQPMTMTSLMLDVAAGGRTDNLRPFHRTSLILHIANACLIAVLLRSLFANDWAAIIAATLFALHPLTVEPIPWIGERKTLLATFFALLTMLAYVRYARTKWGVWLRVAAGTFFLALLSKPTVTLLPVALLLMDLWPLGRANTRVAWLRLVSEKVAFFLLAIASACVTYVSQFNSRSVGEGIRASAGQIPLLVCHEIAFYVQKIFWPVHLSPHYAYPRPLSTSNPAILLSLAGVVLGLMLVVRSIRRMPAITIGVLVFLVLLLPSLQLLGFSNVATSDKFVYLPSIGLLMILCAALISGLRWAQPSAGLRGLGCIAILLLIVAEMNGTRRQYSYWASTEPLLRHMVDVAPDAYLPRMALGDYLLKQHQIGDAEEQLRKAVSIAADRPETHARLGDAYFEAGKFDLAISEFNGALAIRSDLPIVHNNLAVALASKGHTSEAVVQFRRAIALRPRNLMTRLSLADLLFDLGKRGEAIGELREILRIDARYKEAVMRLADWENTSSQPASAPSSRPQQLDQSQ